jgi:hypothetical protein
MESSNFSEGEYSFLKKLSIFDSELETLELVADTYDHNDSVLRDGYDGTGTAVITFSKQLKYNTLPIAELIDKILMFGEHAMGCSVEIEFAGNFQPDQNKKTTFYLLQIRPYTQLDETKLLDIEKIPEDGIKIYSNHVSGNRIINNLSDIVFIKPDSFDKLKTIEILEEINSVNSEFRKKNKHFVLIGFGRWGTSDKHLGIPVKWHNISRAQVIIETGLKDFQIEHSQGSHFFQNITTANIPYFFCKYGDKKSFIDWEWLNNSKCVVSEYKFIKHIQTPSSFTIIANGKTREGFIVINKEMNE